MVGHRAANLELSGDLAFLREADNDIVWGADCNAHTGINGDPTSKDKAGAMLMETFEFGEMTLLNTLPGKS